MGQVACLPVLRYSCMHQCWLCLLRLRLQVLALDESPEARAEVAANAADADNMADEVQDEAQDEDL